MALDKLQKYAKTASSRELEVLDQLENYYKSEYSLGYLADKVDIPLRAVMEFMQKLELPYYSAPMDAEEGLKKLTKIRSSLN